MVHHANKRQPFGPSSIDLDPMPWMTEPFAFGAFDVEPTEREKARDRFVPVFAIHESPDGYEIEADVPGAQPNDVSVEVHESKIIIHCTHVLADDAYGAFTRRLHLSHRVRADQLASEVRDGVLHVRIPKKN